MTDDRPAPRYDAQGRRLPRAGRFLGGRRDLKTGATPRGGLVIGVGVSSRAEPAAAVEAVGQVLSDLRRSSVRGSEAPVIGVTTWGAKADHPVVVAIAAEYGVPVWPHSSDVLRAHEPGGSARVVALTTTATAPGIGSVARAAVLACGSEPLHEKRLAAGCTYVVGWREQTVPAGGAQDATTPADPLRHHGDAEARDCALDFAVNVVVSKPPDWLKAAMVAALDTVVAYPDERGTRLRLADELGLDPERLLLVNGAAEAFTLIAHARPWRAPLVVHPQFTEPDAALRAAGRPADHHILDAGDAFTLHPDAVPTDADLVVIGNPTNPTSRLHPAAAIRAIRDAGPADRLVLVDEAFIDLVFAHEESVLADAAGGGEAAARAADEPSRLCVVRSLTKSFGLAGIRAGYVVGDPEFIARLRELQPPWSVNGVALAAIDAICGSVGRTHLDMHGVFTAVHRKETIKGLTRCGLTLVPDAEGPFVLAHHPDAARLRVMLREKGIAVRRGDTFPGLGPEWLRFAVRPTAEVERLVGVLKPMVTELDRAAGRRRRTRRPAASRTAAPRTAAPKASGPQPSTGRSAASGPGPTSVSTPQEPS